jgi:hypothetical protein
MQLHQLQFSRWTKGDEPRITLKYAIDDVADSEDEEDVLLYAEGNAPSTFAGLWRNEINGELVGPSQWDIEITYGTTPPPSWMSGQAVSEWSFSIDEETAHYTQSLATVNSYAATGTATDHKGAVNVTPDGTVEGYDATVHSMSWSETLYLPYGQWGASYLATLEATAGRWNSTTFRIWPAGELLLRRVRGRPAGTSYVQIEFDFTRSPNVTDLTVGDVTGIDKRGWDLLWIEYEPVEDTTAKTIAGRPKHVYVEQVKYSADFHNLLLPDPFA